MQKSLELHPETLSPQRLHNTMGNIPYKWDPHIINTNSMSYYYKKIITLLVLFCFKTVMFSLTVQQSVTKEKRLKVNGV